MLAWALIFVVLALVAAALGFKVLVGTAAAVAQVLFVVCVVLAVVAFLVQALERRHNS